MLLRFVTDRLDDDTATPIGVFAVAYQLIEDDQIADYQRTQLRETLDWFVTNLPIPKRFQRSTKPHRESKGICWFKTDADDCIRHVRHLVYLVTDHDVVVRKLTTDRPGYIIYEDNYQVVAEPFADTPR